MAMLGPSDKTVDLGNGDDDSVDLLGDSKQDDLGTGTDDTGTDLLGDSKQDDLGSGTDDTGTDDSPDLLGENKQDDLDNMSGEITDAELLGENKQDVLDSNSNDVELLGENKQDVLDTSSDDPPASALDALEQVVVDEDPPPEIKGVTVTFQTYQKTDYECGEVAEYSEQEYEFMKIGMILTWDPELISVMDSGDYDAPFTDIKFAASFDYKEQNYSEGTFSEPQTISESILSEGTYVVGTFTESFDLDPSFMTTAVVYAFAYIDIGALNTAYDTDYDSLKLILLGTSEVIMSAGETETDADGWADNGYTYGNTEMVPSDDALEDQLEDDAMAMDSFEMDNIDLGLSGGDPSEAPGTIGGGSY